MLGVLGRRGIEAAISLFAVLGFCYVPLGAHTGLEHAKAIFSTKAAQRAGAELVDALLRVRAKLGAEALEFTREGPAATPPVLPKPKHQDPHGERSHHAATP